MSRTNAQKAGTSPHQQAHQKARVHFWCLCALLLAAVAFGGGGSRYGFANLMVQLTAIAALSFHRSAFVEFWSKAPTALRILVALSALLPALFIIPLPSQIWTALPGRELVAQSLELAGAFGWATASVDPLRTLLALTALITPAAALIIGWKTPRDHLVTLGWIVVLLGLANMLIGTMQVLSNGAAGLFYPENPMPGVLFGTFANRNSAGLFLVGCLAFATLLPAPVKIGKAALPARILICVMLILAIALTRSRTALLLAILPLAAIACQFIGHKILSSERRANAEKSRTWAIVAGAALSLSVVAVISVAGFGRVNDVVERFENDRTDARVYIWEDAAFSASRYWPVGSGTGTFDDVFQVDESLENITQRRAGRAHNDYLEVAVEAGLPGVALVAGWLVLLGWLTWKARRSEDRWIAWSGAVALLAIACQSATDYPLRNHTMMAFAGFALVLLVRFGAPRRATKL